MLQVLRADQIAIGMMLDLEGDKYATMIPSDMSSSEKEACIRKIEVFTDMYQIVEEVERENDVSILIECTNISFACPPNHKLKVFEIAHPIA